MDLINRDINVVKANIFIREKLIFIETPLTCSRKNDFLVKNIVLQVFSYKNTIWLQSTERILLQYSELRYVLNFHPDSNQHTY